MSVDAFDEVAGRERWWQARGLDDKPNVRFIAESADGSLYVNVHVGGILRSRDRGQTWDPTIDQETDVHEVKGLADGTLVAATGMAGLGVSHDGADSRVSVTDGLPTASGWKLPYTRAVAAARGPIFVTGSNGAVTADAGVYRWSLGSNRALERCTVGLPAFATASTLDASVSPTDPSPLAPPKDPSSPLATWRSRGNRSSTTFHQCSA